MITMWMDTVVKAEVLCTYDGFSVAWGHYLTHEECKVNAKHDTMMLGGCYAVAKVL